MFPVAGDNDTVSNDAKIIESGQKVHLQCKDRWISVFASQLRPIADFFEANPEVREASVAWVEATSKNNNKITVAQVKPAK